MLVHHNFSFLSKHGGVLDDAVVTRRHNNHLLRSKDDLLVVLTDEGLGTDLHLGHIAVLVQHMDVVVWRDAVDALRLAVVRSLGAIHFFFRLRGILLQPVA